MTLLSMLKKVKLNLAEQGYEVINVQGGMMAFEEL